MKHILNTSIITIIALIIVFSTLIHGSIVDISIFHGMILHPIFLLAGLSLFALVKEKRSSD